MERRGKGEKRKGDMSLSSSSSPLAAQIGSWG